MAPTLCLVVGYTLTGVPTDLYIGNDYSAAQAAAAAGGVTGTYPLVQVFRNLAPYQEFRFPPA
jgi:hypothetical protein